MPAAFRNRVRCGVRTSNPALDRERAVAGDSLKTTSRKNAVQSKAIAFTVLAATTSQRTRPTRCAHVAIDHGPRPAQREIREGPANTKLGAQEQKCARRVKTGPSLIAFKLREPVS